MTTVAWEPGGHYCVVSPARFICVSGKAGPKVDVIAGKTYYQFHNGGDVTVWDQGTVSVHGCKNVALHIRAGGTVRGKPGQGCHVWIEDGATFDATGCKKVTFHVHPGGVLTGEGTQCIVESE